MEPRWLGAVLTGGRSARMGTDKAFVDVQGTPLVALVAGALRSAGADRVVAVGGDATRLRALGLDAVADPHVGEGPMAGFAALANDPDARTTPFVVAAACDLPALTASAVRALLATVTAAGPDVAGAIPVVDGIWQSQLVALRPHGLAAMAERFAAGERALWRTVGDLGLATCTTIDPAALVDLDSPEDVADYARRSGASPHRAHPEP